MLKGLRRAVSGAGDTAYEGPSGAGAGEPAMTWATAAAGPMSSAAQTGTFQFHEQTNQRDTCGAVRLPTSHGYLVTTHKVVTWDHYELTLHRLVHPEDAARRGPPLGQKKPYLLVHGLLGSSASWMRGAESARDAYWRPPAQTFDVQAKIKSVLELNSNTYEHSWQCLADKLNAAYPGDRSRSLDNLKLAEKLMGPRPAKKFCSSRGVDFDGDQITFGREFRQAHRKFEFTRVPAEAYTSPSLAYTLSNIGYDVWMINLRGNKYSQGHMGKLTPGREEYWDFGPDTIVQHDLPASISYIQSYTHWREQSIGLVAYSYSAMHVLGLLTSQAHYQDVLQPVVLAAPTMLMARDGDAIRFRHLMKALTGALIANQGPFPSLARSKKDRLERLVCNLPVAGKMCRFVESTLHGQTGLRDKSHAHKLMRDDVACGQTSTQMLHTIVENIGSGRVPQKLIPFTEARLKVIKGQLVRRSVIVISSESDNISTPDEVMKISDTALKLLLLADITIRDANFNHADFLFSQRNQYLVNAEIARAVAVFDFVARRAMAHVPQMAARGI